MEPHLAHSKVLKIGHFNVELRKIYPLFEELVAGF